jgi:hypothetical protein
VTGSQKQGYREQVTGYSRKKSQQQRPNHNQPKIFADKLRLGPFLILDFWLKSRDLQRSATEPNQISPGKHGLLTKVLTGYWAGGILGLDRRGRIRAGAELVARGEFSIVIAGLGVAIEERLGPVSAAYVLLMAIAGPVLARMAK